jgi:hypothetical protein
MIDIYALYGLVFLPFAKVAAVWAGFTAVQVATAAYALRLDGERYGPLWSLPLQQIVYRQLMYLVVVQSTVMALLGSRLRWHRMARTGAASAHAQAAARDQGARPVRPPGRPVPRDHAVPRGRTAQDPGARRHLQQTMSGARWPSN